MASQMYAYTWNVNFSFNIAISRQQKLQKSRIWKYHIEIDLQSMWKT